MFAAAAEQMNEARDQRARSRDGAGDRRLVAAHHGNAVKCRRGEHARHRRTIADRGYAGVRLWREDSVHRATLEQEGWPNVI
jgi:hypothetical protein